MDKTEIQVFGKNVVEIKREKGTNEVDSLKYEKLFDLNLNAMDVQQSLSSKYEAKINVAINVLNFSIAIWAISVTLVIDMEQTSILILLAYAVLSLILILLVIWGWILGFSSNEFKEQLDLPYGQELNKAYIADSTQFYSNYAEELSKAVVQYKKNVKDRASKVKKANKVCIAAMLLAVFLTVCGISNRVYSSVVNKPINSGHLEVNKTQSTTQIGDSNNVGTRTTIPRSAASLSTNEPSSESKCQGSIPSR